MDLATTYALTRHFVNPQTRSASNLEFISVEKARKIARASVGSLLMGSENFLRQFDVAIEAVVDIRRVKRRLDVHH
jgi:hypothetical protein